MIFQRGRVIPEYELNEAQDNLRVMMYRLAAAGQGTLNPGSSDDGYLVVGTSASNSVTIKAGTLVVDGLPLYLDADEAFAGFTTYGGGGSRTDRVYLAVSEQEVTDPSLTPKLGETTRRQQLVATLAVAEGTAIPADSAAAIWEGGVRYFEIASVTRASGVATIDAGDVTDSRYALPSEVIASGTTNGQYLGVTGGKPVFKVITPAELADVIIRPASFATTQDDYGPTGFAAANFVVVVSTAEGAGFSGFDSDGLTVFRKTIFNGGAYAMPVWDASSTAGAGSDSLNNVLIPDTAGADTQPLVTYLMPNTGMEIWYDTTVTRWRVSGISANVRVVAESSAVGTQNNFTVANWPNCDVLALTPGGGSLDLSLTGLAVTESILRKPLRLLTNRDVGFRAILEHENASSTAANRFSCPGGIAYILHPGESCLVYYDQTLARWLPLGHPRYFEGLVYFDAGIDVTGGDIDLTGGGDVDTHGGDFATSGGRVLVSTGLVRATGIGSMEIQNATTGNFNFTSTQPVRTVAHRLAPLRVQGDWAANNAFGFTSSTPNLDSLYIELDLPNGAILSEVRASISQTANATTDIRIRLQSAVINVSTGAMDTIVDEDDVNGPGASAPFTVISLLNGGTMPVTIDNTTKRYFINVTACSADGVACSLNSLKVVYSDPGPRNY